MFPNLKVSNKVEMDQIYFTSDTKKNANGYDLLMKNFTLNL